MAAFGAPSLHALRGAAPCILPAASSRRPHRAAAPHRAPRAQLRGIDLGAGAVPGQDELHDKLLGQLMFAEPEKLPELVARMSGELDDSFLAFIDGKVGASADIEERESLRLFKAAILDLKSRPPPPAASASDESAPAAADPGLEAYDELIDTLLAARAREGGLAAAVLLQYERIDLRALQRIEERAGQAAPAERAALQDVLAAITAQMQVRVDAAAGRLRATLGEGGGLEAMKRRLDRFAAEGALDDAFVLLLQKNFETAVENGAKPAAEVLGHLLKHATHAAERALPPELQLVRQLLRAEGPPQRETLLTAAFEKRGSLALADGAMSSGVRVNGKKFVEALRGLIEQYGNVDKTFVEKLSTIGEESEAVARKIYGMEDKDVSDMQDEAFHKRTVSVWDLEKVELAEEVEGRKAGWEGQLGEIPSGFNEDRKMII